MKTLNIAVLENALNTIEGYIQHSERINTDVSKVNVAWQLDHSLKVINSVVKNMQNSDSELYLDNFSFLGKLLLKLKYFPRGKAKAPKYVMPSETILIDDKNLDLNSKNSWRSNIGYVPQFPFMADDTIVNNIALGVNNHFTLPFAKASIKLLNVSSISNAINAAIPRIIIFINNISIITNSIGLLYVFILTMLLAFKSLALSFFTIVTTSLHT